MKALIINGNGHSLRVVPVFDWFRPTFYIGLTILTTAIRRGSITACLGAPLHVLMCLVETRHAPTCLIIIAVVLFVSYTSRSTLTVVLVTIVDEIVF